ncbi:MAG: ArsR/SmtB family transcription factor [Candidatus Hodarchaeales archaeon]|jgi:DNA-binding transcriptional ArsR family regulator
MSDDYSKDTEDERSKDENTENFDQIKKLFRELKNDLKDEFQDIRDEIEEVKENVPRPPPRKPRPRKREFSHKREGEHWKDWGEGIGSSLEKYIGSILESVWDTVDQSVGSLFQTSSGSRKTRRKRVERQSYESIPEEELENFYQRGAELLSALSDQKRLRMLKELEKEPLRQSDLSEKTDIKGGNFKHHITILKDEGLVHQEGVRERYMLTFAGREALKLAEFLYHRAKKPAGVPIEIDEDDQSDDISQEE